MTARSTDWGLALLVALLAISGLLSWFDGRAWVFVAHGIAGMALAVLLAWKLPRVWPRVVDPRRWTRRTWFGALALTLVAATLVSGWLWSGVGEFSLGGFTLLAWHDLLGALLAVAVLAHLVLRAKPLGRHDLGRRQLLTGGAVLGGGLLAWQLQRSLTSLFGLPASERRFTGSYEAGSFEGNSFPVTSWVADDPAPLDPGDYRLRVEGLVAEPLELAAADLDNGDELEATLDCTGGFYSTQRWRGVRLASLLERARPAPEAGHIRVISHTGYRWSFSLADADGLLLATQVSGEQLSHGHGAPARLVAPGRRGFQWVKWVTRIEVTDSADPGAFPSTIFSSFSDAGRGRS